MNIIPTILFGALSHSQQKTKKARNKIAVCSCTVEELFNCVKSPISNTTIEGQLIIPEYQRPYVWASKEIEKLLTDLDEHNNDKEINKPPYYLGSIILHQQEKQLNIIDGQQRITTLAIIQAVKNEPTPNIKYASPVSIENIKNNYKFFCANHSKTRVKTVDISQLNITLIVTQSEDDAYTFFETQNTGGVRLSGVDIIKAHHLREITTKGNLQDNYATTWENQHHVPIVVEYLIKARRWNALKWVTVPSDKDHKGTRVSIIEEFSEWTLPANEKAAYQFAQLTENYSKMALSPASLAMRQPIANGENFIDYLQVYCNLYQRLFQQLEDKEIEDGFYDFNKAIIQVIDGTSFLKELFEIAMICYASKFGMVKIKEAAYWLFRYCYSTRVSNQKTVREESVPAFIQRNNFLFDHILSCYSHQELIKRLRSFAYEFNADNTIGNTVKSRFIKRVKQYFEFPSDWEVGNSFDEKLKEGIIRKINE